MLASKRGVYLPKLVLVPKRQDVPANYVVEMYDNGNDTFNVYTGYTRYEIFYCSEE